MRPIKFQVPIYIDHDAPEKSQEVFVWMLECDVQQWEAVVDWNEFRSLIASKFPLFEYDQEASFYHKDKEVDEQLDLCWYSWEWEEERIAFCSKDIVQFTWLLDKNWNPIFEGDILGIPHSDDTSICDIVFKDGCFKKHFIIDDEDLKLNDPKEIYTLYDSVDKEIWTVIGNIYENPELLPPHQK